MSKFKRLSQLLLIPALFMGGVLFMSMEDDGGRIKVYLQNKCSSDAKFKVASPGSSTHYTVDDGYKKPFSFLEGTKVYDVDGRLVVEIDDSDEGKTFVICD